jgi:hypothetical protein
MKEQENKMILQALSRKLEKSEVYQKFISEHPNAFLCAGFFILNFKSNIYEYSLDFREERKIFTFKIPEVQSGESKIIMTEEDLLETQVPLEKISLDVQTEIDDLKPIVEKALMENKIKNKLEEIIAVLQNLTLGKDDLSGKPLGCHTMWNLTCMCEGFTIITVHISSESGKIIKFEKKSLFDMIKKN